MKAVASHVDGSEGALPGRDAQGSRLSFNLAANLLGQIWVTLLLIALVPILIRYLGVEAYGIIGLFMTFHALMAVLDAGMGPTLNREMARFTAGDLSGEAVRDLLRSIEFVAIGLCGLVIAGFIFFSGPASTGWLTAVDLPQGDIRHAFMLMGAALGCRFLESLYRAALLGLRLQVWYNAVYVLLGTLRHGGATLLVVAGAPSLPAFFAWYLGASLLMVAVYRWRVHRAVPQGDRPARASLGSLRAIRRFASGMFAVSVLAILLTQVDKLLISHLLPLDLFGTYMLAVSITSLLALLAGAVTQAFLPLMVQQAAGTDDAGFAESFHLAAQVVALLVIPCGLVLVLWPTDTLYLWSGDTGLAQTAAPFVRLLAVGSILHALMTVPYFAMVASGWTRLAILTNLVAVALLVPALWILVPRFGAIAAAAIWVALNAGYVFLQVPLIHRRILVTEMRAWYLRDVGRPFAIGLVVGLGLALARDLVELSRLALVPWLVGALGLMLAAQVAFAGDRVRRAAATAWTRIRT
jgi:O-antigen/teichoic acid export membrane protein